ncbi:prepilin peptidase [Krasilnikovia cinnamomea]|uniref:prepilin peptidase n=1 Tax=Krasilnikovia cinnamomea TaxID=349313 RepID=UPI0013EF4DD6|nr:A24 family peptidase [Krasilnikovia cinnamomea]
MTEQPTVVDVDRQGTSSAPARWRIVSVGGWLRAAVTACSVPAGTPRMSGCPKCGRRLFAATGPGVTVRGACAGCGARLGPRAWVLEFALAAALAALVLGPRPGAELPAYGWFAVLGILLAAVDIRVRRLPNMLTAAWAGGVFAGLGLAALVEHRGGDWVRAALAGVGVAVLFAVIAALRPGALGWGDVKAAVAVGAVLGWLGWAALYAGVFVAFALAAGYAIVLLARGGRRQDSLPFGPFLVAGAVLVATVWPAAAS